MAWTAPRTWADPEVVDAAIMNAHIRDNFLNIGQHQFVRKTAQEQRSNTATFADDSELVLPLRTAQTWEWELRFNASGSAGGAFKWQVTAPSGSTGTFFSMPLAGTAFGDADISYPGGTTGTSSTDTCMAWGIVTTTSTAGNLAFQWAQSTSDADPATVAANGTLSARRIS